MLGWGLRHPHAVICSLWVKAQGVTSIRPQSVTRVRSQCVPGDRAQGVTRSGPGAQVASFSPERVLCLGQRGDTKLEGSL